MGRRRIAQLFPPPHQGSQTVTTGAVATGGTTTALQTPHGISYCLVIGTVLSILVAYQLSAKVYQQYLSVFGEEVADATAVPVLGIALILSAIWFGFLVGRIKTGCFLNFLAALGFLFLFLFTIMIPIAIGIPIAPYFHVFDLLYKM